MKGVAESMAGRAAVFSLLPFSAEEAPHMTLRLGGFPEVLAAPGAADIWFRSYVQTYLERDVRAVTSIRDLATFRRFMGLLASRCGRMLNKTDLAAPLGIRNEADLAVSPFRGPLFEGLVASEIVKHRLNRGLERGLYTFRDRQGLEVDFVVDEGNRRLLLIEAKATRTPMPDDGRSLTRLARPWAAMTRRARWSCMPIRLNTPRPCRCVPAFGRSAGARCTRCSGSKADITWQLAALGMIIIF